MAVTHQPLNPRLPRPEDLDPSKVVFSFDRLSDTLIVHLCGRGRPAVSDPVGDHLYLMIDVTTEEIVGFQIEEFLLCVVREHPSFLEIAELAGVPADEIAAIRRDIALEARQQAAFTTICGHLAALSYGPEELDSVSWSPPVLSSPNS